MIGKIIFALLTIQSIGGFKNLDFEKGQLGNPPKSWTASHPEEYRIYLDDKETKQGKYCAVIERKSNSNSRFGSMRQYIDATPYRGKHLRLSSFVRTETSIETNRASLFVAVYRANRELVTYNNNNYQVIQTQDWKEFHIATDVGADAELIDIGLVLEGEGRAFWDDIRLTVLDSANLGNEPPRPLEERGLQNLVAFSRLLGYLRYFYPGDETLAGISWERFAIDGIRYVESAKDEHELVTRLQEWCSPVASAIRVFPIQQKDAALADFSLPKDGATALVYWKHQGIAGDFKKVSEIFRSERVLTLLGQQERIDENAPSVEQPYFADLGGGVGCLIPLALYVRNGFTLPEVRQPNFKPAPPRKGDFIPSGNDRATRLANIALAWNVLQHFYPYFDVVQTDWMNELPRALRAAAVDLNEKTFLFTLRRMVAALRDGHGWVQHAEEATGFIPPISWDWVEGRLVVTRTIERLTTGIEVGDIVDTVNGLPAEKVLAAQEEWIPAATPQWARWRSTELLLQGPVDSSLSLTLQGKDGKEKHIFLKRNIAYYSEQASLLKEFRPEKVSEIAQGIIYFDLTRSSDEDFESALLKLANANGIIFDLRGYPHSISYSFLRHFFDKPFHILKAYSPIAYFPDRTRPLFTKDLNPLIEPIAPYLRSKVVFLADERAISYAETILMTVEGYKLGKIIGSTTAGTNGVVNKFELPGGYQVTWTGNRTLKHNNSTHHGVGVVPTIPAPRTVRGIREGIDETIETAQKTINSN